MTGKRRRADPTFVAFAIALATAACTAAAISQPMETSGTASSVDPFSSCEDVVIEGGLPSWADAARVDHARYVISADGLALGVLWADPLVAGGPSPDRPSNKILWIVNRPRQGSDLVVTARPRGRNEPTLVFTFEAHSGPGEIYPSEIYLPEPGCWEMQLAWVGHRTRVVVPYEGVGGAHVAPSRTR